MLKKLFITALSITALFGTGAHLALADTSTESANKAAGYLLNQKDSSGSIGGVGYSGWAIQGLTAAGQSSSQTLSYIEANLGDVTALSATDLERTILAILAGGHDPHNVNGTDLVALLKTKANNNQIGDTSLTNDDIFGILALLASGESVTDPIVTNAIQFLVNSQRSDGSFSWSTSGDGDSNDTAGAVQALRLAQKKGYTGQTGLTKAQSYLASVQHDDGGFSYQAGFDSDGTSTAWVVMAINALNESPEAWVKNNNQPISYLQSLQTQEGGVQWQAGSGADIYTTAFAAIAFAGKALPVAILTTEPSPSPDPTSSAEPSPTETPTPTPSVEPTPTPSVEPSPTPSMSPSPLVTATPTPTPSVTPIVSPSLVPTPSTAQTPSPTPSVQPSNTATPSPTPTTTSPSSSPSPKATSAVSRITSSMYTSGVAGSLTETADILNTETSPEPEATTAENLSIRDETPTPTADTALEPTVKGESTVNTMASTVAAALLILIGLLLITWGIVTYVKYQTRRPE